jgi:hypothetical protein
LLIAFNQLQLDIADPQAVAALERRLVEFAAVERGGSVQPADDCSRSSAQNPAVQRTNAAGPNPQRTSRRRPNRALRRTDLDDASVVTRSMNAECHLAWIGQQRTARAGRIALRPARSGGCGGGANGHSGRDLKAQRIGSGVPLKRTIPRRHLPCDGRRVKTWPALVFRLDRHRRQKLPQRRQIGCIRCQFLPIIGRRQTMTVLPSLESWVAMAAVGSVRRDS